MDKKNWFLFLVILFYFLLFISFYVLFFCEITRGKWTQLARMGRVLGLKFDEKTNRVICADAMLGLLALNLADNTVEILSREAEGIPFQLVDAGIIYIF
jgi:hypothetical protein